MEKEQNQGHSRHMLTMLICCLAPVLLILALIKFGVSSSGLFLLLILLCPLGHILMMRGQAKPRLTERSERKSEG